MAEGELEQQSKVSFYPVPSSASLTIASEGTKVEIQDLVNLAMHLSIDNPKRKVSYWIRIEKSD